MPRKIVIWHEIWDWYLDVTKTLFIWLSTIQGRHYPLSWAFPSPPHWQFQDQHNTTEIETRSSSFIIQWCNALQFFIKRSKTWYCCFFSVCTPLFMSFCHPTFSLSDLSRAAVLYNEKCHYILNDVMPSLLHNIHVPEYFFYNYTNTITQKSRKKTYLNLLLIAYH